MPVATPHAPHTSQPPPTAPAPPGPQVNPSDHRPKELSPDMQQMNKREQWERRAVGCLKKKKKKTADVVTILNSSCSQYIRRTIMLNTLEKSQNMISGNCFVQITVTAWIETNWKFLDTGEWNVDLHSRHHHRQTTGLSCLITWSCCIPALSRLLLISLI